MSFLDSIRRFTSLGYDAAEPTTKRRTPASVARSEDSELTPAKRQQVIASTRDLYRNFSLAAWAVRRHLDYVSTFSFQAKSGNDALDDKLEALIAERSKPARFDIAGRHWRQRFFRIAEARKILDGDCGVLKINTGHVQAVEGDRIRSPWGVIDPVLQGLVHGVKTDKYGRALGYAVCKRNNANGFEFERLVSAQNMYLHAAYDRFDQVRGISPLASAYNTARDTYEGVDYSLVKMKAAAIFGMAIYRDDDTPIGSTSDNEDSVGQKIDFGRGPLLLDLDRDDKAEFLENKTPSVETQQFFQLTISLVLKALDIPYSFFAENFTNYSGSRGARLQYETAAETSREANRDMHNDWSAWQIVRALEEGELPGASIDQIVWQWVHRGEPWLNPIQEVQAEHFAISAALDNYEDVAQRHGRNVYENIDKIARVQEYAASKGVPLHLIKNIMVIQDSQGNEAENGQAA